MNTHLSYSMSNVTEQLIYRCNEPADNEPETVLRGLGSQYTSCRHVTKNAGCQHVYLHDGILVQLFAFLQLFAFALLG